MMQELDAHGMPLTGKAVAFSKLQDDFGNTVGTDTCGWSTTVSAGHRTQIESVKHAVQYNTYRAIPCDTRLVLLYISGTYLTGAVTVCTSTELVRHLATALL